MEDFHLVEENSNTQPPISEAMIRVATAFGMQDFETFSVLEDGGMTFSVWLPNEEAMELKFRLYLKEDELFDYDIDVYDKGSRITGKHARIYNFDGALNEVSNAFFNTSYEPHIYGGFYLLGVDIDTMNFLFTAHERLEMMLEHKALMQKLSQLALTFNLGV